MRILPFIVNLISAAVYGYVFYFDYGRKELDMILPIPGNSWTKFMFLTFCNLLLQLLYHIVAAILALTANVGGRDCLVRKSFHFYAVSIAFPLALTVVLLFWGLYFISPELVLTPEGKVICSVTWYNHTIHTFPLFCMILDFITWRHPQPSIKNSLKAIAVFVVFYLVDVHCFKYYTNIWAYPIMSELNTSLRLAFFGVCAVICTIDFFIVYGFNSLLVGTTIPNKLHKKRQ